MTSDIYMVGFGAGVGGGGTSFPEAASLQGSWNLFGGDATQTDNSGNGNDLSPKNSPGQATGPDGVNCADLDRGSSESYSRADASVVGLSPGSGDFAGCIFWAPETLNGHHFITGKYENSGNGEWFLFYDFNNDAIKFIVRDTGGGSVIAQIAPPSVGSFAFLQYYIDTTAQEVGLAKDDGAFTTEALTLGLTSSTAAFTIGERGNTGNDFVNGKVAIAHIWNTTLTSAQWTQLYNGGNGLRYSP